ncbi:MAG: SusC/RagA family TonB-linked outer membrane protein, partial [Prolixibacteraceae bacterium]|nr:SusC/RagA family TonB-linked outer membrane protein [Prolixibacteraceae bacterium]
MKKFRRLIRMYGFVIRNHTVLKVSKMARLTLIFMLAGIIQTFAVDSYSQSTKLTLNLKNARLETVLRAIENQSEFFFLYNKDLIDVEQRVDINAKDKNITEVLDVILTGKKIRYYVIDRQIVLSNQAVTTGVAVPDIIDEQNQFQQSVSGKVTDERNQPLPGVTVIIKGTTQGTVTDIDGVYSISNVPAQATLVFSFVGMRTQEITVGNQTTINITLAEESIGLEEVVAVGYGTQRKATLTGSVSGITNEEVMKTPSLNLSNSLAGLMPGLVAMNRTGQPGSDNSTFLVRGNSTTGNNTPLILVDGIPETGWQRIDPNDIESVSVLKDAAASIYGVQAANGVILITTKRGATGKPIFNITVNQAITQPTRVPEMASSATLAEYGNEFLVRTGNDPMWTEEEIQKFRDGSDPINYPNTNWVEECFKRFALQESANLNIRGGSENVLYSV